MNINWRGALIYLLILIAAGALILGIFPMNTPEEEIPISDVARDINNGIVKSVAVEENTLEVTYKNSDTKPSRKENGIEVAENLLALGVTSKHLEEVDIQVEPPSAWGEWLAILGSFLPFVLLAEAAQN